MFNGKISNSDKMNVILTTVLGNHPFNHLEEV